MPAQDNLNVIIAVGKDTEAQIEAVNVLGQTVISEQVQLQKGYTEVKLNVQPLAAGTYLFRVTLIPPSLGGGAEHKQKMFMK
ncbi:MAG: T9SS type A sorting domain-containing protein [Bacteroidetes bacterium]|nr:T9SS type A sorting domain-containing protein [Bacteroidota bacterium]